MFGVTGPKPIPYIRIVSPGCACRVGRPTIEPGGRTNVPSVCSAATYCLPPTRNDAGASSPGCDAATAIENGAESPFGVLTTRFCVPGATFDGTCTFTCPGEM